MSDLPGESKKYTHLMSHKSNHCINLKDLTWTRLLTPFHMGGGGGGGGRILPTFKLYSL